MNTCPVVMVHGLLGFGPKEMKPLNYWGYGTSVNSAGLPVFEAAVGPVSSFHDRACELFAQIKGIETDYGEAHAKQFGHNRFSTDFTNRGLYPAWDIQHPIHLVGHSAGGNTIRMLQHLLSIDYWKMGTTANWVKSINCISAVLNGSTGPCMLGCDKKTGLLPENSVGDFVFKAVQMMVMATGGLFDGIYDWDLDQWELVRQPDESMKQYVERIAFHPFMYGKDNLAYDLTVQGCYEFNGIVNDDALTHYFSYVTEQSFKGYFTDHHFPELFMNPMLIPMSAYIGSVDFDEPPIPTFGAVENWYENDGCVPTISQKYPWTNGRHAASLMKQGQTAFVRGTWHWDYIENSIGRSCDHLDIAIGSFSELSMVSAQKKWYESLYQRLASL